MATLIRNVGRLNRNYIIRRYTSFSNVKKKGVVLGIYEKKSQDKQFDLTSEANKYREKIDDNFNDFLQLLGPTFKTGDCRVLFTPNKDYSYVAVVGLGKKDAAVNSLEDVDEAKENIRTAVAKGVLQLRDVGANEITIDPCGSAEAAAEGATLALYNYDELKNSSSRKPKVNIEMLGNKNLIEQWQQGTVKAESQNFARKLMEMPANHLRPSVFADMAVEALKEYKNVTVSVRKKPWIEDKKMGAFLSVAKGSIEEPVFLEISYNGKASKDKPFVVVGKGITFDSGGISLKPSSNMDKMRGDMGGGACTLGSIKGIAALQLPINVIGLIPLCENMPSGGANKPGDVVTAMNGKTIQVDNTDAEGRLILADALTYAHQFNPWLIMDMATLTGAMMVALGSCATGVFTNSTQMWKDLYKSGMATGDRVWRMPLYSHFSKQVKECHLADLNNITAKSKYGGACSAAAFLKEFVNVDQWLHLDIAGVMENSNDVPYLPNGLTGRPTRTVIEFARNLSLKQ